MMNRGVLQSSPVQQMMAAGNPNWWNINNLMRPPLMSPPLNHHHHHQHHHPQQQQQQLPPSSSTSTTNYLAPHPNNNTSHSTTTNHDNNDNFFHAQYINIPTTPSSSWLDDHHSNHQEHQQPHHPLQESWSQLLLGEVCMGDEDQAKKIESWEEQIVLHQQQQQSGVVDVKQESSVDSSYNSVNNNVYNTTTNQDQEFHHLAVAAKAATWPSSHHHHPQMNNLLVSSPQSCVTTFSSSNSMLDFSSSKSSDALHARQSAPDRSSECNSTANGGAQKKAKVQQSPTQTTFKVRKEKLGDRITALHQLVSPFGKTDTASVLLEAIGYIRFLQSQIEALSLPYLSSGAGNKRQPNPVPGERNCIFPEDPGQLLNDNCLKRKGGPDQESYEEPKKDLRSRGLCLVPVSCTLHMGSDNGADYWAPAFGGGFR